MITIKSGDIFTSKAECLVNPVNCVGVSGAGLAKAFAANFPTATRVYEDLCRSGVLMACRPIVLTGLSINSVKSICLFPTKQHWRDKSPLWAIKGGLITFQTTAKEFDIKSYAFPALGCGLGGLSYSDVLPLMQEYLGKVDADIEIWEPR